MVAAVVAASPAKLEKLTTSHLRQLPLPRRPLKMLHLKSLPVRKRTLVPLLLNTTLKAMMSNRLGVMAIRIHQTYISCVFNTLTI